MLKLATVNSGIYGSFVTRLLLLIPNINNLTDIAVAVSGGSDSLALSFLMAKFAKENNINLHCITIDHQLRSESSEEAEKTKKLLAEYGIHHITIQWIGDKPKANIQEKARIARYTLLTEYCRKHNINYLCTGHQKNDQAENFIIRAEHGSGLYGLAGIPKLNEFNQIHIARPLLEFSKNELIDFLKKNHINWCEDPSNQNEKFTRVKIRKLLGQSPEWVDKLAALSDNLAHAKEAVEYTVNEKFLNLVTIDSDQAIIKLTDFNLLPQEIRFRLMLRTLQLFHPSNKPPRGERLDNLLNKIKDEKNFKASTLAGCLIAKKKDFLIIKFEPNYGNKTLR